MIKKFEENAINSINKTKLKKEFLNYERYKMYSNSMGLYENES